MVSGLMASETDINETPPPPENLRVLPEQIITHGTLLHRVHQQHRAATAFNPGPQGNARFSPIQDAQGNPIPTLYGGITLQCALMETVFHDVPHTAGDKSLDRRKLTGQVHSVLQVEQQLHLVRLTSVALRCLGVTRKQIIDTEKDQYPATRQWAAAIHRQCPHAQGLYWTSRQDDTAQAVMLYGDRIPAGALVANGGSRSLLDHGATYDAVLNLVESMGFLLVDGFT